MDSAPPFRFDEPNFLHYPSKNDFKNVFQYLFQCIEPTFRVQKIEQHALNLLNLYGYPYALNARTMQTITYPTSWGQLLGALDWMIDIVEADIDLTADLTKASPKMIIRTQQHVNMVFNKLFDGSDEFLYSDLLQPDARRTKSVMAQLIRYYKLKCDMAKHLSLVDNQIDEQVHAYDFEKACERTTNAHDCEEALGRIEGRNEDFMSKDGDLIKSWTLRKSKRIKNIERIQKLLDEAQRENARQMFLAEQKRSISGGKQTKSQARGRKSQIRILDELKHMETEVANMRQKYDQAIQINRKLQRGVGELRVTGQCLESLNSGIRKLEMLQDSMVEMRAKDGEGRKAMQMQEELNATSLHYRGRPYHLTDSGEADMDIELTCRGDTALPPELSNGRSAKVVSVDDILGSIRQRLSDKKRAAKCQR
uniref:Kinetochore protein NDC80 n=1 Tax=Globodera pallida TaxID=36090 RepID=A0A183BYC2_GLOPA